MKQVDWDNNWCALPAGHDGEHACLADLDLRRIQELESQLAAEREARAELLDAVMKATYPGATKRPCDVAAMLTDLASMREDMAAELEAWVKEASNAVSELSHPDCRLIAVAAASRFSRLTLSLIAEVRALVKERDDLEVKYRVNRAGWKVCAKQLDEARAELARLKGGG